jgi:putative transposase
LGKNLRNNSELVCKYCGSTAVVKFGTYNGIQRYWCKNCKRKFKADDTTFHMKTPTNQVSSALSMYYEGMSVNAIKRHLKQEYDNSPSTATIYEWVQKYTQYAIDSAKGYHPHVGDVWIADETVLNIDGQDVWLWDVIDDKTRFLLATRLSTSRTTRDAQMLMDRAIKTADKTPKVVVTDKLASYLDVNYGKDVEHRQGSPFSIEDSTSLIERFHGTLKSRTKVMRGLKNIETAHDFMNGWLVFYNYLRPHESLDGKTPARVAGVGYPYENWADIIRRHEPSVKVQVAHVERGTMRLQKARIGRPHKRRVKAPKPEVSMQSVRLS